MSPAANKPNKKKSFPKVLRRSFLRSIAILPFLLASSSVQAAFSMKSSSSTDDSCKPQNVLVIGANGKTGFRVIQLLQENPIYQPKAMIREASQAPKFDQLDVPWIVGDLEVGDPSAQDLEGSQVVIFAAGAGRSRPNISKVTIDYLGAVRSMAAAQATQSVERFILLSGINSDPGGTRRSVEATDLSGPLSAWHRLKAHSETYIKESHLHGRQIDWTILCPGRLLDDETGKPGTGFIKASLIHGEDDLRESLTPEEQEEALKSLSGSHDGKMERLCISRDNNTALALVALLNAPNTVGKSITVVDGLLPPSEAFSGI